MLRESFLFPLATRAARRDMLVGGLWMLTTLPGWILNLGHRLDTVRRVAERDEPAYRGFRPLGHTFGRGLRAFLAIAVYLSPTAIFGVSAALAAGPARVVLGVAAGAAFAAGVFVLPGGMTWYAVHDDASYLVRPDRALRRALDGGRDYLRAWGVAVAAVATSLLGLLAAGVGFLFTSVWAWSVVGYAFTRALIRTPGS